MGSLQGLPLWEERGHECEVGGWKFLSALLPAAGARKGSPGAMLGHSRAAMLGFAATVRRERLVGNFLSITKRILVEILAGLLWLDLKMGGIN